MHENMGLVDGGPKLRSGSQEAKLGLTRTQNALGRAKSLNRHASPQKSAVNTAGRTGIDSDVAGGHGALNTAALNRINCVGENEKAGKLDQLTNPVFHRSDGL